MAMKPIEKKVVKKPVTRTATKTTTRKPTVRPAAKKPVARTATKRTPQKKSVFHPIKLILLIILIVTVVVLYKKVMVKVDFLKTNRQAVTKELENKISVSNKETYKKEIPNAYKKQAEIDDDITKIIKTNSGKK